MPDEPTTGPADELAAESDTPTGPPRNTATRTSLTGRFLRKAIIFLVAGLGLGIWGFIDATIVYPERGERYISRAEHQYLKKADEVGALRPRDVSVADPAAEYRRLDAERKRIAGDLLSTNRETGRRAELEEARLKWLEGLARLNRLDPEHTTFEDPVALRERLDALEDEWRTAQSQPKPLAAYDIPSQWVFVVVGFGVAIWQIALIVTMSRRVYRWDPETKTLTLPGGATLRPEDIRSFDKRKWDRFLVFLGVRDGHPQVGGQELKLDLYRHKHLEDWVKEQFFISDPEEYRRAFPEEFETEAADAGREDPAAADGGGGEPQPAGAAEDRAS